MNKLKILTTALAIVVICFSGSAQKRFEAEPHRIEVTKSASFEFFYYYSDLTNLTDSILEMRWVRIEENNANEVSGTVDNPAGNWDFWMTDPQYTYSPSIGVDSGDFQLNTADVIVNSNKIIYQIFPKGEHGISFTKFRIFPIDHPEDYLDVSFKYIAEAFVNATDELSLAELAVYYNDNAGQLVIKNESAISRKYTIYNIAGSLLGQGEVDGLKKKYVNLSGGSGIVLVVLEKDGLVQTKKVWVGRE